MVWEYEKANEEDILLKEIHPALRVVMVEKNKITGDPFAVVTFLPVNGHKEIIKTLKDEGWNEWQRIKAGKTKLIFLYKLI